MDWWSKASFALTARSFLLLVLLISAGGLPGCGGATGSVVLPPPPPPPTPSITVTVTPTSGSILLGNSQTFAATVTNTTNTSVSLEREWHSGRKRLRRNNHSGRSVHRSRRSALANHSNSRRHEPGGLDKIRDGADSRLQATSQSVSRQPMRASNSAQHKVFMPRSQAPGIPILRCAGASAGRPALRHAGAWT